MTEEILNVPTISRLPPVARRLIGQNRQRRVNLSKRDAGFRGNLDKTLAYLRWKADCGTLFGAMDYIAGEIERERIYALYREIFPREWRKSKASFRERKDNEFHTEREFEFFKLVNENYFPLSTWLDWSDFRFDHIPIEPVNLDFCCGEFEWQEFRPCLRFAVAAFLWRGSGFYDLDWQEILADFKVEYEDLPPINHGNPPYYLLESQRDNPKIYRFLHLIEFIDHNTGNPFIDTTCCSPVDLFEWTRETLEKLKADYAAVADYFASMDILDEEIEQNALKTFKELISLWNTGRLPMTARQKEAADKMDDEGGLLINILAETENFAEQPAVAF